MSTQQGKLSINLIHPAQSELSDSLVERLNQIINPPTELTADEINIRAMYILSDSVNSFGGRFPTDELEHVARLMINSPVLVGHRKDKLPIARNFKTVVESKEGINWIKSYFYWLKETDGSETLKNNIDGGIYKECSIGFVFNFAQCSICKRDIRECGHQPLRKYKLNKFSRDETTCHIDYREISKVLETSLVYRGSNHDTSLTNKLSIDASSTVIESLSELPVSEKYLVIPFYQSIPVSVLKTDDGICIKRTDTNRELRLRKLDLSIFDNLQSDHMTGCLVGFKGKERCQVSETDKYLAGKSSEVSRIELKIIPSLNQNIDCQRKISNLSLQKLSLPVSLINHRVVSYENLALAIDKVKTKYGVMIFTDTAQEPAFLYYNSNNETKTYPRDAFRSVAILDFDSSTVTITQGTSSTHILVNSFSKEKFQKGRMFVAQLSDSNDMKINNIEFGTVSESKNKTDDRFRIFPALLNNKRCLIIRRSI